MTVSGEGNVWNYPERHSGASGYVAEEILAILDTAKPCKQIFSRSVKKLPTMRGRVVVNLFYEPSTRTRASLEMAGKWMSADVLNFSVSTSSVTKGESFTDTAMTMQALGADIIVIRHQSAGAPHLLAAPHKLVSSTPVTAFTSILSQALLDLFTIRERKGTIEGLTVTIVGDILHSRVARSNIWGLKKLGAKVRVAWGRLP